MEPNTFLLILTIILILAFLRQIVGALVILGTLAFVALGSVGLGIMWVIIGIYEAVDNKYFRPRRIRKAREKFNRK